MNASGPACSWCRAGRMTPRPKHPENKTRTRSAVSPAREPARKPARSRSSECHGLVVPREGTRTSCQLSYRGSDELRQQYERAGILCRLSYWVPTPIPTPKRAGILCRLSYWGSDTNTKVDIIYIIRRCGYTPKRTKLWVYGRPSAPVIRLESPLPGDLCPASVCVGRFWGVPTGNVHCRSRPAPGWNL